MRTLAVAADERVSNGHVDDEHLTVDLMNGRTIGVPIAWYPRLADATSVQRANGRLAGGGYGIHWPDTDEDLFTEGLSGGAPAPRRLR
jgi:hypothetical protein